VIGFERDHVAFAVVEAGVPVEKTFTLTELVRLLPEDPPSGGDVVDLARAQVAAANEARQTGPAFVAGEDIADPIGAPLDTFVQTADAVSRLVAALVKRLFATTI
jgi:hypothetical protein